MNIKVEAKRMGKHPEVVVTIDGGFGQSYFGMGTSTSEWYGTAHEARTKLLPALQQAIKDAELMQKGIK